MGLERYTCTRCRHGFWHRLEERRRVAPPVPDGAAPLERHDRDVAEAPAPDAALAALDPGPGAAAPGPPDLAALDEELARLRGTRRRR